MPANIVVVGSTNVDMVVKGPHIPRPGETVTGGEFTMTAGGKGANQAVAAARLGASVTFIARTGRDSFGPEAVERFSPEGIRLDFGPPDPEAAHGVPPIVVAPNR